MPRTSEGASCDRFSQGPGPVAGSTFSSAGPPRVKTHILAVSWEKGFRWGLWEGTLGAGERQWVPPGHAQASESFSTPA